MRDLTEFAERAATVHTAIAADLSGFGGILRSGWPKCCGYTMTWVTQRLLDEERARA